jgi:hypothetical protein
LKLPALPLALVVWSMRFPQALQGNSDAQGSTAQVCPTEGDRGQRAEFEFRNDLRVDDKCEWKYQKEYCCDRERRECPRKVGAPLRSVRRPTKGRPNSHRNIRSHASRPAWMQDYRPRASPNEESQSNPGGRKCYHGSESRFVSHARPSFPPVVPRQVRGVTPSSSLPGRRSEEIRLLRSCPPNADLNSTPQDEPLVRRQLPPASRGQSPREPR